MEPRMNKKEIRAFKKELLKRRGRSLDILEWGSGGSTVYFTRFLRKLGISYSWISLEYNKFWFEKISQEIENDKDTSLVLFDVGNNELKQRHLPMDDYVNYPNTLNKKFDIIFVDGRKRRRGVLLAKSLLKEDGVVLLHDARRYYYRCAQKEYHNSVFVAPEFWRGSLVPLNNFSLFLQKLQNLRYSFMFYGFVFPLRFIRNHTMSKFSSTQKLLSLVKSMSSKLKILLLVIVFAGKKRGIGFGDFSVRLLSSTGRYIVCDTSKITTPQMLLSILEN
jgi:hypothetical protein